MSRIAPLLLALGAGCVAYAPRPVDPVAEVRDAPVPPPGPLAWEDAVRFALDHNPDLLALRALAEAAGPRPPPAPPEASAGVDDGQLFEAGLRLDALSLLGLGPRRAEIILARARREEARLLHHQRAREVAGELAEAYEVERVYRALPPLPEPIDPSLYVRAGLLPAASEAAARANRVELDAEREERLSGRAQNRLALLRLLGARPGAALEIAPGELPLPPAGALEAAAVLRARADVQSALAGYEVADAEFRRAVAGQFPKLALEPSLGGDPLDLFGLVSVSLPIGAGRAARAAHAAREAARERVRGKALDAVTEAEVAAQAARRAAAQSASARERALASELLFRSAQARLATERGVLGEFLLEGQARVAVARELREAALADARARVAAARAAGWPGN